MCISYGHDHDTTDVLDFGDQYRTTPVILEGYRNRLSTCYARINYLSPTIFRRSLHCQLHACGDVESVDSTAIYEWLVYMAFFVFSKWLIFDAGRVVVTETCYSRVATVNPEIILLPKILPKSSGESKFERLFEPSASTGPSSLVWSRISNIINARTFFDCKVHAY